MVQGRDHAGLRRTTTGTSGPTERPTWLGPSGQVVWHPERRALVLRRVLGGHAGPEPAQPRRSPRSSRTSRASGSTDVGVDGFRLDAAKHLIEDGKDAQVNTPETNAWLAGFRRSVDAVEPDALLIGEVYDPATIAGPLRPRRAST